MNTIRLADTKTPAIDVELADGSTRNYCPFEIARRLDSEMGRDAGYNETIAVLRSVFALSPEQATDAQLVYLMGCATTFITGMIQGKGGPPARPS